VEGKVCLSLLGTWDGEGSEVWDPRVSTLLQVLVSMQGLILGSAQPYFLEAGYEVQRGTAAGLTAARLYNERAFIMCALSVRNAYLSSVASACTSTSEGDSAQSCVTSFHSHFDALLLRHFQAERAHIVEFFDGMLRYGEGAPVNASSSSSSSSSSASSSSSPLGSTDVCAALTSPGPSVKTHTEKKTEHAEESVSERTAELGELFFGGRPSRGFVLQLRPTVEHLKLAFSVL
jgi:hypothetical protein